MKDYRKFFVALGVVVVTAVHQALTSGSLTLPIATQWTPVAISVVGAVLVYLVRNGDKPEGQ